MKPEIKEAYMQTAELFSQVSNCKKLKVGAIVVKNGSILAHGWNGTPSGFHTNCCEKEDGSTNPFVLHAEQNANDARQLAEETRPASGKVDALLPYKRRVLSRAMDHDALEADCL